MESAPALRAAARASREPTGAIISYVIVILSMNVVDKVVLLVVNVLVFLVHWDKTSKDTEKG